MHLDFSNSGRPADPLDFPGKENVFRNLDAPHLYEEAVRRAEARIGKGGALVVETGVHTGRCPQDKFIVRDLITQTSVWWENSQAMSPDAFDRLRCDMIAHAMNGDLFAQDLYAGADRRHRINIGVYTELAWHSLFIRNLLICPNGPESEKFGKDLVILDLPSFRASPSRHGCNSETIIAVDFSRKIVLIGGTHYAGEIKKAVFGYLNFVLPPKGVLPMHCAANAEGDANTALFFGLSGTGKTTLSADAARTLIGDDEHGWSPDGVFNFEGGCYAKAIKLSRHAEPEIFAASERFGTVLENVVLDPATRTPNFNDDSLTENTRIAYPLDFIPNASPHGRANHPRNIVMLTCDAFGVLPPISKLDSAQAMYHFLSGYTAKVAGTEKGVREPQATFSTCFGAPFMPRHPSEYGNLLREFISMHNVDCWLVNTGWTRGQYGVGERMPIQVTRKLLQAVMNGSLAAASFRADPYFGVSVPRSVPGVTSEMLDPVQTWKSESDFALAAEGLVKMFKKNFIKFEAYVDDAVIEAQPKLLRASSLSCA